uniref:Bis(5'-adenosyl)-triphosphatase n=1 Tax=Heligmosomoides polygyrus TaxID=6339 RepID=A0A183GNX2_HELPZ
LKMFLLRYAGVDNALRQFGARSDEADQAIARVDLYIHELQVEHDLFSSTNLIVLSDHGLAQIEEEEQFYLEECLSDYSKVTKVVNLHSMLMVFTEPEDEGHVHFELRVCDQWAPMGDYEDTDTLLVKAYKLSEIPERLHWAGSRFMSGVVLLTKPGTSIITRELSSIPVANDVSREAKQTAGWDPDAAQMRGIFMARGPAFKVKEKIGPIEIVDVYQVSLGFLKPLMVICNAPSLTEGKNNRKVLLEKARSDLTFCHAVGEYYPCCLVMVLLGAERDKSAMSTLAMSLRILSDVMLSFLVLLLLCGDNPICRALSASLGIKE